MQPKHLLFLAGILVAGGIIYATTQRVKTNSVPASQPSTQAKAPATKPCTPTFVDGGGPYYKLNAPYRVNIAPEENGGEKLVVTGKVIGSDCTTPLAGVVLDIWQANESGSYQDEWYRGKVTAQADGTYRFETVIPKGYGEGTGYRPPHIHFKASFEGKEIITSQMFLPEARAQQIEEAYIMRVETREENGATIHYGYHDVVLPQ